MQRQTSHPSSDYERDVQNAAQFFNIWDPYDLPTSEAFTLWTGDEAEQLRVRPQLLDDLWNEYGRQEPRAERKAA